MIEPAVASLRSNQMIIYPALFQAAQNDALLKNYLAAVEETESTREFKRWACFDVCAALTTQGIAFKDLTPGAFLHYAIETREAQNPFYR